MTIAAGSRLGPYEILAPIGAGGMGEVYRARDTRLDRSVAIKVLPAHLSSPEMRQRFEREAKAVSQLSHPHICTLFDVGRQGDVEYLVMELLEGESLSDRVARGALSLELTLRCGIEIAEALDRAHRHGIVHRDLKPGNVMLTKSGVKLLDFGLAKELETPSKTLSQLSMLPTTPRGGALTQEGTILGTFQYMAPEQLEGKDADARTDIFALGAVIYEMATGRKAFSGPSQASLISAIMQTDPPPISSTVPVAPAALDRITRTCLAKDPEDRWQSAGDVAKELKWVAQGAGSETPVAAARSPARKPLDRLAWPITGAALLVALFAMIRGNPDPRAPEDLTRFAVAAPSGQRIIDVALSPDARRLLFTLQDDGGKTSLAVRSLDSLATRPIAGTEGARSGLWSPDGRDVAFFAEGKLRRVGADGGPVQTVCDAGSGFRGSWSAEGTILFTRDFGTPISAVPAAGGTPRDVTSLDQAHGEAAHFYPAFLPDGKRFLYVARNLDPEKTMIMLGSTDSKAARPLFHADSGVIVTDAGYVLFARDNAVFAWKFDSREAKTVGDPTPAFEQVYYATEDNKLVASAARDRFAYLARTERWRLVWIDRKGREVGSIGDVAPYADVRISPDGQKIAVAMRDASHGQNLDVWVLDAARGIASRVTSERTDEFNPTWFPDGERLAYVSDRAGFYDIYERPIAGGAGKVLVKGAQDKMLPTVSPDGVHVLFGLSETSRWSRVLASLVPGEKQNRLTEGTSFSEEHPVLSPDGRWTAFESDESTQRNVYVQPLAGGPKRQVSVGGGQAPTWARDGSELFYVARDGMLTSVLLKRVGSGLEIGEPQPLFPLRLGSSGSIQSFRHSYDVSPDGQRFLVIRRAADTEAETIVVTNWTSVLKKTAPAS